MTNAGNLNDTLLPVTPSMERYTVQCCALHRACGEFLFSTGPQYTAAEVSVFVNNFTDNNEHDELGNWADVHEYATQSLRTHHRR